MNGPFSLHVGECLEWLRWQPDGAFDHCITDPPYDEAASGVVRRLAKKHGGEGTRRRNTQHRRIVDFDAMTPTLRAEICVQLARTVKRWSIIFCQAESVGDWKRDLEAAKLKYRRAGIWVKSNPVPNISGDGPGQGYESIVCAHPRKRSRWNGGGLSLTIEAGPEREVGKGHGTVKPQSLMRRLVELFTERGELIVDPFAGTGSTGVAAVALGRRFAGCELQLHHAETATARLAETREQLGLPLRAPPASRPKQLDLA